MQVQLTTTETDLVHCRGCGFTSADLSLTRCECGEVLGETIVTRTGCGLWARLARAAILAAVIVAVLFAGGLAQPMPSQAAVAHARCGWYCHDARLARYFPESGTTLARAERTIASWSPLIAGTDPEVFRAASELRWRIRRDLPWKRATLWRLYGLLNPGA
jgi:hypothetical protein